MAKQSGQYSEREAQRRFGVLRLAMLFLKTRGQQTNRRTISAIWLGHVFNEATI